MNKPRSIAMAGGRPTIYKPENAEIARHSCMLGATNDTLAERFAVCRRTIDNWIATIPDFSDAVRQGREVADEAMVSALFTRATGMEQKMTKVFCHRGQPVTADYTVHLPPDVRACIFWLRNRRPDQWRENRPLVEEEEHDPNWVSELEAASERVRLAAVAERSRASADQSAGEGAERREADAPALPVPSEAEGSEAERAVRSAAERLHVHTVQS
jgi:hypothetical protein